MPLVAIALAAYVAGLLAGFAHSVVLAIGGLTAAVAIGMRRGRDGGRAFALGALVVAGGLVAATATATDERCLATAAHRVVLTLVLDDSVGPGTNGRARLDGCEGSAWLAVEQGEASAGSTITARGEIFASQRGLLVQHAAIVVVRGPPLLGRLRTAAGHAIDRTFRGDAPLVRALLIADRRELTPEVRDSFAAAGLAHILAIAGLHIGIIAAALALALELSGVPRRRAAVVTIVVVIAYVAMIGAPIPALRSATMLTTLLLSRLVQRPTSRWAIVALGASQPVLAPRVVLDAGYQLSVVGVAAMIAGARLSKRLGAHRRSEIVKAILVTLIGTTVATIASAPIVAWVFGRVSVIAPLSNLAAAPLIALAQPMIFCGLVLSPIHPLAALIADAAHPILAGLTFVATTSASIPNASITVAPTAIAALIACAMSAGVLVACLLAEWTRPAIVASLAAMLLVWLPVAPAEEGLVELHMIDVGQGDAIALRTPHAHWILFDAGGAWRGGDAGRSTVIPYLGRRGGTLDLFVLSHPHTDHVGGAPSILRALHPAAYVDAGFPGPAESYRASLDAARDAHVRWVRAHPGDTLTIDGVALSFLAPDSAWTAGLVDPNLASVVALVRVGNVRMLLMGDAERPEEDWLLAHDSAALSADVLKVGHHGSATSSTPRFLRAVRPRLALVSVGAGNSYHLPSPDIMRALAAQGAQVLRTDRLGTIVARTDGHRIFVETAGDAWELPPRSQRP
ncbi:MAG: internalization-related competence protein ComEC/Rec2 [Gemmatimonadetes bacterium]|nr:internalization-related competence protein ComEC/Rec2 [Gemmatimonadota bacterium]